MQKKAFTLAEMLITLAIVGAIASLTIPPLVTNFQDAQYRIGWKNAFSILFQATNRVQNDNGGTLAGIADGTLAYKYFSYMKCLKRCDSSSAEGCWHTNGTSYFYGSSVPSGSDLTYIVNPDDAYLPGAILNNGMLLFIWQTSADCTSNYTGIVTFPICGFGQVDTNGFAKPNQAGKDIFGFWITKDKIVPTGTENDRYVNKEGTWMGEIYWYFTGYGKSAEYLMQ